MGANLLRFVTVHAFDRQTDGRRDGQADRKAFAIPCAVALHAVAR